MEIDGSSHLYKYHELVYMDFVSYSLADDAAAVSINSVFIKSYTFENDTYNKAKHLNI